MLNKNPLFGRNAEPAARELAPTPPRPGPAPLPPAATVPQAAPPARPTATPAPGEGGGSKLIVGPDIKLKGVEITDCDTLVVEGRVEATMDSRVIQIAENGAYAGTVGIDIAEIRGRFEGELTARRRLVVYATGSVSGTIRYGKVVVEEGGTLSGDVRMLGAGHDKGLTAAPEGPSAAPAAADLRGMADAIAERSRAVFAREPAGR